MNRKIPAFFYLLPLIFINSVCPNRGLTDQYSPDTYYFTVNGSFNDLSETIKLGDTLKLEVRFPDTITAKNYLGDTRSEKMNSLQTASYGYRIYQVDTVNRSIISIVPPSAILETFLSAGREYATPRFPYLQTTRPFTSILNIIPRVKGIFYIEIVPQRSPFKVNDNYQGLFSVNFNAPDKHFNLVVNNYTQGAEFLAAANERNTQGFGMYAFRVN